MNSSLFELLCVVMLGLGQLCIMTGYDTQSFILESVIHSVHGREPQRIDALAGYYGQGVCYAAYMIACMFSPSILHVLKPKMTLFMGSVCFTIYQAGFFYINSTYYYTSMAIMGVGFALFYTGHGGYLTSHSTRKTLEGNSSLAWSIACACMVFGAGILFFVFKMTSTEDSDLIDFPNSTSVHHERIFHADEIFYMYFGFTAVTFCANIIFLLTPSTEVENCIEGKDRKVPLFRDQMVLMLDTLKKKEVVMLIPLFSLIGFWTSFWISVYPTSLTFNTYLSHKIYLPVIYSLGVGIGEIIMGLFISFMSRRVKDFGLQPTVIMGTVSNTLAIILIFLSTPNEATTAPTSQEPFLFQPNEICIFILALIIGLGDCCFNNVRTVICALAMPSRRPQAFSVSKFYQALAGTIFFFVSAWLDLVHYLILLLVTMTLAAVLFFRVARKTQQMERKLTMEQLSRNQIPL